MSGTINRRLRALEEAAGLKRCEPMRVLRVIVGADGRPGKTYERKVAANEAERAAASPSPIAPQIELGGRWRG